MEHTISGRTALSVTAQQCLMHVGLNMLLEHELVGPSPIRVTLNCKQHSCKIGSALEDLRAALSTHEMLIQQSYVENEGSVSINRVAFSITLR
jgi:hypothetical protein